MRSKYKIFMAKAYLLPVVVVIMLVITIIGLGLIRLGSVNALETVKVSHNLQAFWSAEAGGQRALFNLPATGTYNGSLGNSTYTANSDLVSGFNHRYQIISTGNYGIFSRTISIIAGPIFSVIMATDDINIGGNAEVSGELAPFSDFSFEGIFGASESAIEAMAVNVYTNPANNFGDSDPNLISGITWINGDFRINNNAWYGSGLLIVKGDLDMQGGRFDGIIWVDGELRITGNSTFINGAIFANSGTDIVNVLGTPHINYDAQAIDDALDFLGSSGSSYGILFWQEI